MATVFCIASDLRKMLDFSSRVPKIVSPSQSKGHIQIIFGPMFSGKTTELIRRLKKYQIAKHKCLIVKYMHDSRYSDKGIATHDRQTLYAVSAIALCDLKKQAEDYSVIGIDEGQFFPGIVPFSEEMANSGKIIIIAALDGTFQRKGFSNILQLIPLAENVLKLNSVCMLCFQDASFSKRIGSETEVEVIGGTDKYMAVCRSCHKSNSSTASQNTKLETSSDISVKLNETQIC